MKIKIKKIIRSIPLKDYAEEYPEDVEVRVWVNPPRSVMLEREELDSEFANMTLNAEMQMDKAKKSKEAEAEAKKIFEEYRAAVEEYAKRSHEWYSVLWSQDVDKWPLEDITELSESDPALLEWLFTRTRDLLREHRAGKKKD